MTDRLVRPVVTKSDYYKRWQNQEFGNKLRSWANIEAIAPYSGMVSMRHVDPSSNLTRYCVPVDQIAATAFDSLDNYRFNESAPDSMLLLQGEICYDHQGWHLLWSTKKTSMRNAMTDSPTASKGLVAREILKHFCCPNSFSDIEALIELYPEHVIEFGCYSKPIGNIAHRNTVIWEVRKY